MWILTLEVKQSQARKPSNTQHNHKNRSNPPKPKAPNVKLYKPASEKKVVTTKKQPLAQRLLLQDNLTPGQHGETNANKKLPAPITYRGGPRTRSQNCSDFWTHIWSRANRYCKAFEASLAEVRGLPRPPEASLMGFRGLPRPHEASTKSQNPFSLQDYEASGTRAYNSIKRVPARPRARTNPGCLFHVKTKEF